jgi:hypothetical protein
MSLKSKEIFSKSPLVTAVPFLFPAFFAAVAARKLFKVWQSKRAERKAAAALAPKKTPAPVLQAKQPRLNYKVEKRIDEAKPARRARVAVVEEEEEEIDLSALGQMMTSGGGEDAGANADSNPQFLKMLQQYVPHIGLCLSLNHFTAPQLPIEMLSPMQTNQHAKMLSGIVSCVLSCCIPA